MMYAAPKEAADLWDFMERETVSVAPNYIRDGTGRMRGWLAANKESHAVGQSPDEAVILLMRELGYAPMSNQKESSEHQE